MERIDKYCEIIKYFIPTRSPNITIVEKKDNTTLLGFFMVGFEHKADISKSHKLLFVPNASVVKFREEFSNEETMKKSIDHCLEVDVDEIRNVKLVNEHSNLVQFSLTL
jgi:hypothetical protein